jgi:cell division protein ZapA (FtsZ GTPase activity inhibitor)
MKRSVHVEVAGLKLQLKTDADEAYVKSLARHVSEAFAEVKAGARNLPSQHVALLAAMNVADELLRERRRGKEFRQKVRDKARRVLDILEKEARR